ncbi:MAG: 4Fe-4S ferredoxin [Acidimicrobiia bacterium]|nr:4Fe-4S ferredoxin [Acidimicrobiia bacterium]
MKTSDLGFVEISPDLCKGCGLCLEVCVPRVLELAGGLNRFGYRPAVYLGQGCNGCGLCFYACPEPGAIQVFKQDRRRAA